MRQAPRHAVTADARDTVRHVPQRTCVGCRRTRPKSQLLRLVATGDMIQWDDRHRLPGRGAYVCPDPRCVDAAARRDGHAVQRALRTRRSEQVNAALDVLHVACATSRLPTDGTHHEEHTA